MCADLRPVSPKTKAEYARFVFSGRATKVTNDVATFDVERVYSGSLEKKLELHANKDASRCRYAFEEGREYLVYANLDRDGNVTTHLCSGNVPLICAREDVTYFGDTFEPPAEPGPFDARGTRCLEGPYLIEGSRALLTTYVDVDLIVDTEGNVRQLTFKRPASEELEKAVRAWRFKPAMLDGKVVEARLRYIGPKDPRTEKEAEAHRW